MECCATLYVEQFKKDDNTIKANQISNLTYKGDFEKISKEQIEENSITVHSSIEGIGENLGGTSSHIQEFTTWKGSSFDDYAMKENEFEVVVEWGDQKETFTMTYNEGKTSEVKCLNGEEIYTYFYKPQK